MTMDVWVKHTLTYMFRIVALYAYNMPFEKTLSELEIIGTYTWLYTL